jgi:hypothetical protein
MHEQGEYNLNFRKELEVGLMGDLISHILLQPEKVQVLTRDT